MFSFGKVTPLGLRTPFQIQKKLRTTNFNAYNKNLWGQRNISLLTYSAIAASIAGTIGAINFFDTRKSRDPDEIIIASERPEDLKDYSAINTIQFQSIGNDLSTKPENDPNTIIIDLAASSVYPSSSLVPNIFNGHGTYGHILADELPSSITVDTPITNPARLASKFRMAVNTKTGESFFLDGVSKVGITEVLFIRNNKVVKAYVAGDGLRVWKNDDGSPVDIQIKIEDSSWEINYRFGMQGAAQIAAYLVDPFLNWFPFKFGSSVAPDTNAISIKKWSVAGLVNSLAYFFTPEPGLFCSGQIKGTNQNSKVEVSEVSVSGIKVPWPCTAVNTRVTSNGQTLVSARYIDIPQYNNGMLSKEFNDYLVAWRLMQLSGRFGFTATKKTDGTFDVVSDIPSNITTSTDGGSGLNSKHSMTPYSVQDPRVVSIIQVVPRDLKVTDNNLAKEGLLDISNEETRKQITRGQDIKNALDNAQDDSLTKLLKQE